MFLDVIGDVLLGTKDIPGILPDLLAGSPPWLSEVLLYRPLFLVTFTVLVIAPISLQRSMDSLASLNVAGLVALFALGASLVWLSASAVAKGRAHVMPMWPDIEALGGGPSAGIVRQVSVKNIILVLLPSFAAFDSPHYIQHFVPSVHPYDIILQTAGPCCDVCAANHADSGWMSSKCPSPRRDHAALLQAEHGQCHGGWNRELSYEENSI